MRRLARAGSRSLLVRATALRAIRSAEKQGGQLNQLLALFRFVRDKVRFVRDPVGIESLASPDWTLTTRAGDCDDKATALAALALSVGIGGIRFRSVSVDPRQPGRLSHVYLVANIGGRELALDPTYSGTPAGWQVPGQLGAPLELTI